MLLTTSTWASIRDALLSPRPLAITIGDFRFCLEYAAQQQNTQHTAGKVQTTSKTINIASQGRPRMFSAPVIQNCSACEGCNGLCKVLRDQSVVQQLLQGEKIPLFSGPKAQLVRCATQGCAFAKLINHSDSEGEITRFLQRADQGPANEILLVSILRTGQQPKHGYLFALSTTPGMLIQRPHNARCTKP